MKTVLWKGSAQADVDTERGRQHYRMAHVSARSEQAARSALADVAEYWRAAALVPPDVAVFYGAWER